MVRSDSELWSHPCILYQERGAKELLRLFQPMKGQNCSLGEVFCLHKIWVMGIREDLDILDILDWRVYGSIFENRSNLKAIPAVKHTKKHQTTFGKSPFSMAKSTISKSPFSIAKRQVTLPARLILNFSVTPMT